MEILLYVGIFIVALAVLLKGSDWLIESAENVGAALGIPSFIIGLTIVAFGTSLPELATSIAAVLNGESEIVLGNVIGSNIANIGLVLGLVTLIVKKIDLEYNLWHIDMPYLIGSSFLLYFVLQDRVISTVDAIFLLASLVLFLIYSLIDTSEKGKKSKIEMKDIGFLLLGGVLVWLGADYTVMAVSKLSAIAGISADVIAVTVVALGTSLPEVIVSIKAARKGNTSLAVGNILGSNIFNTYVVVAIPALFGTIVVPESIMSFGLPFMIAITFLFAISTNSRKITNWEGALLLMFYLFFFVNSFLNALA